MPREVSPAPAKGLERQGEPNPFGLALFNPWPERGAVELGNGDKESKMFRQML